MKKTLEKKIIWFPTASKLKILILKYLIDKDNKINFKKRK